MIKNNVVLCFALSSAMVSGLNLPISRDAPTFVLSSGDPSLIQRFETTFYPGSPPSTQEPILLGTAFQTSKGQASIYVESAQDLDYVCGASSGEWCVFPNFVTGDGLEQNGTKVPLEAYGNVKMHFNYDTSSQNLTFDFTTGDGLTSSLSVLAAPAIDVRNEVLCSADADSGLNSSSYKNTTFTLATSFPDFAQQDLEIYKVSGVTPQTQDGGKTFTIQEIDIEGFHVYGPNKQNGGRR